MSDRFEAVKWPWLSRAARPITHKHGYRSVQQEDTRKEENLWGVLGNPVRQAEEPDRTSNHADHQREHQGRAAQLGYLLRVAAQTVSERAGDAKTEDASEKDCTTRSWRSARLAPLGQERAPPEFRLQRLTR